MSGLNEALPSFELVAGCFYEKFRRPAVEVMAENIERVDAPELGKEMALTAAAKMTDIAVRKDLSLMYGMQTLKLRVNLVAEQDRRFIESGLTTTPDITINTFDPDGIMAKYDYDRRTGLIIVNSSMFASQEVRPITEGEIGELGMTISGEGLARAAQYVLTQTGTYRLVQDLATAYTAP